MSKQLIYVRPDGRIKAVVRTGSELSFQHQRRVSRVEPSAVLLRLLFLIVRFVVSDRSKIAEATRRWPCKWRIRFLSTGEIYGPYKNRTSAISAEIQMLEGALDDCTQSNFAPGCCPGESS